VLEVDVHLDNGVHLGGGNALLVLQTLPCILIAQAVAHRVLTHQVDSTNQIGVGRVKTKQIKERRNAGIGGIKGAVVDQCLTEDLFARKAEALVHKARVVEILEIQVGHDFGHDLGREEWELLLVTVRLPSLTRREQVRTLVGSRATSTPAPYSMRGSSGSWLSS
jgi:hypothetical protein